MKVPVPNFQQMLKDKAGRVNEIPPPITPIEVKSEPIEPKEEKIEFNVPQASTIQIGTSRVQIEEQEQVPEHIEQEYAVPEIDAQAQEDFTNQLSLAIDKTFEGITPIQEETPVKETISGGGNAVGRYPIFDLYWLINPKFEKGLEPEKNESHMVALSFNIGFGNLRISFFKIPPEAVINTTLFMSKCIRTVSGVVYPASIFRLLNSFDKMIDKEEIVCIEQIINYTGEDWQHKRPITTFKKDAHDLLLTIEEYKQNIYYRFTGWQLDALKNSLEFIISSGFKLTGESVTQRTILGK